MQNLLAIRHLEKKSASLQLRNQKIHFREKLMLKCLSHQHHTNSKTNKLLCIFCTHCNDLPNYRQIFFDLSEGEKKTNKKRTAQMHTNH